MGDPPTYDEAVAKRNSTDVQSGANGPLHDFAPSPGYLRGKSKLFGLWEAEKWGQLRDAIGEFGNSPVTMESNFSTEKVDDVLDAIRTWISMAKLPPPTMNRGCPYSVSMDSAITAALKRLGSLYNDLQKYAGQMQTFDPPSRKHFVDLAKQIHAFIEDMK